MDSLKLFLLGTPRIERDGTAIEVDTRKAIALLTYLVMTRQSHTRDALATLLWPELDQSHARAALRRTLSALRKALGGTWLDVDRETIGLRPDADPWLDVDQFRDCLERCQADGPAPPAACYTCLSPLAEAVALYRGDFLAGFTLRDSAQFDDWQYFETEGLRREFATALERLAFCYTAQGELELAIEYARRWLALDPLHEPAHRHLMQLYAWTGQRSAALHQYAECVRVLQTELGVVPLEETEELYEAIKTNQLPPRTPAGPIREPASAPPPARSQGASGYPLVGRAAEMGELAKAYSAIAADGWFVVLEGEAGIGKTRLAETFLAYARAVGAATVTARCYEGETNLAYGPFVEGLRAASLRPDRAQRLQDVAPHWLSEAARLLPELAELYPELPPAPPLDNPGAQSRFFEGIRQALLAFCRGPAPGIFFIDDLHWADAASLELFTFLARRLRGQPLCILITWRSGQVPAMHPLRRLLGEMQRAGIASDLALTRLSRSAVGQLAASALAGDADRVEVLSKRLHDETEGVPFLVVEYLATISAGAPVSENEVWPLPSGVRDLVHSRLAAVSEIGRQVLTAAAVIGRSFDFESLRVASGRGDEETVEAVEELISRGLIREVCEETDEPGSAYDFSHEKLRAVVYEEANLARRRLLHRRVATALADRARGDEPGALASQIAWHYRQGGQPASAAEYYALAGKHARGLFANAEALSHYQRALELGHPDRAVLYEAIGDLHTLLGNYSAALADYGKAAASDGARARLEHKIGEVHHRRGEWDMAEQHFDNALAAYGEVNAPGERARLYADWSLNAHQRDETAQALSLAHQALELATAADDVYALAQAHNVLGILARHQGDADLARHHLERSLDLAETLNDPGARIAALNNLALVWAADGETERALQLAETALEQCTLCGDRHHQAALHSNVADLLHASGQREAAMAHFKQAAVLFAEIGRDADLWQPEIWKLVEW
jgi:predicted ATPase/DNA-binding SARP family transcriptional activator